MLNLSELAFKVNTDALVDAANKIAALGKSVEGLQGSFQKLEKTSVAAEKAQAQANKANAEAALLNAKTANETLKGEALKEKAIKATTKATEEATTATKNSMSILERQTAIQEFVAAGYTKGQASVLTYAKALGVAKDEIAEIGRTMQVTQSLIGGDPFDKSNNALRSLQGEFNRLKEAQRLFTAEIPLTRKQMDGLAQDKLRLVTIMKSQGASLSQIKAALKELNIQYIASAAGVNRLTAAEEAIAKTHREAAQAAAFLEKEMQRVNFALQEQNTELNKGTANALNRFEQNLKRSGLTLDQQRVKMDEYRKSLLQLEKSKGSAQTDYISRALGPQITDIFVGLATGQSPLTVMLQQGGQLRDQFALAGVAAGDMGATMRTAAREMVTSVAAVAGAFKDLLVGAFIDTGKGVLNLIGTVTGLNTVLDKAQIKLLFFAGADPTFGGPILAFFNALRIAVIGAAAALTVTGIGALIAMAVALKQVISENNSLARSLALSGGSLALSHSSAIQYVESLGKMGVTTGDATKALVAMAKEGDFTKNEILMVGKAAADMATFAGVAVEDTVKAFGKLKDKPVEALIDIAKNTGMVSIETIKMVQELQKAGKTTEAAALAMKTYADVTATQVEQMKTNYNGFSLFIIELGKGIKQFFSDAFKTLFLATDPTAQLQNNLGKVQERIKEVKENLTGNQKILGMFGISVDTKLLDALQEQERQLLKNIDRQVAENQAKEQAQALNVENAKNLEIVNGVMKDVNGVLDKQAQKTMTLTEYTKKYIAEKTKLGKFEDSQLESIKQAAKVEWEAMQKKDSASTKNPSDSYYATLMREATAASIKADDATKALTASQIKMLEAVSDPRFLLLSETQKSNYLSLMASNVATEQQTAHLEKLAEAEEHRLKLLGKSEGIGKQYYADMKKLEEFAVVANWSREEVEELTRAVFMSTPAWKEYQKALEEVNSAARKFQEDSIAQQAATLQENTALDYRVSLLGKTTEEQKALTIEYQRANKIAEVGINLAKQKREIDEKIAKAQKDGLPETDYRKLMDAKVKAEEDAAEKIKVINREVAVAYAEDLQREIDAIRNGISDAIVTALFEGGKAGAKKIRDVIVGVLRQKVTLVVDAVVNTLLGNVIGSLLGGGGGGIGGAVGGGTGGLINAGMQGYSLYSGLTSGTGILGRIGSFLGLGGAGSAVSGAITGAGATGLGLSTGAGGLGLSAGGGGLGLTVGSGSGVAAGAGAGGAGGLGALATAAPYILAIVAIAASWKKLFGRELKDSGIQGKFGGKDGFEGQAYRFYKGGLFRSDKTELSPIDKALQKQLGDAFTAMKTQVTDFAKVLGLNADKLKNFTSDIKISLHGMNENDISAKIQEALATVNNEMAQEILGEWEDKTRTERRVAAGTGSGSSGRGADDLDSNPAVFEDVAVTERIYKASKYAKEGEKAIDTLTRLATSLSTVNQVFDTLGYKMYEASLAGGDMASKLADLFGGLDKLVASSTFYYQNFYSEAERQATAQRQLEKEFKKNNLTMPKTREEYRKLVEAQDLSTEEGRKMYALLLQLAPAFAEITQTAEEIAAAAKDKLRDALEGAYDALEKAVNAQKELLQQQAQTAQETVNRLKGIFDLLSKNVKELYMQVDSTAKMLASQGRAVIQQALSSGVLPDQKLLEDSISAVRSDIDSTQYATQFEQDKARLQLAAELQILQDQAGAQLSTAELILKGIKDQLEYLDNLLKTAREQIDAALGITNAVMSVEEALKALADILKPAAPDTGTVGKGNNAVAGKPVFGPTGPGPSGPAPKELKPGEKTADGKYVVERYLGSYGTVVRSATDEEQSALQSKEAAYQQAWAAGTQSGNLAEFFIMARDSGISLLELSALAGYYYEDMYKAATSVGVQRFATGGAFTNSVVNRPTSFNMGLMGEAGPEAILPLTNVGGKLGVHASSSSSSDSALESRVDNMSIELQAIAINTSKVARLLERVTRDGESLLITDAATI